MTQPSHFRHLFTEFLCFFVPAYAPLYRQATLLTPLPVFRAHRDAPTSPAGWKIDRKVSQCRRTHSAAGYIKRCRDMLHILAWEREDGWGQLIMLAPTRGCGGEPRGTVRSTPGHSGAGEGRSLEDRVRRYARHDPSVLGAIGTRGSGRSARGRTF